MQCDTQGIVVVVKSSSFTNTLGLENILMALLVMPPARSLLLTLRVSLCRGRERSSCVRIPWSVGEGECVMWSS